MPTKQHRRPAYPIFRVMKDIPAGEPPPAQLAPLLPCLDLEPALLLEILEYGGCRALDIPGEAGGKIAIKATLAAAGIGEEEQEPVLQASKFLLRQIAFSPLDMRKERLEPAGFTDTHLAILAQALESAAKRQTDHFAPDPAAARQAAVASARAQAAEDARQKPATLREFVSAHAKGPALTAALSGVCRCAEMTKVSARLLLWHVACPIAMFLLLDLCNRRAFSEKVGLDSGNRVGGLLCMGITAGEFWAMLSVLGCAVVNPALVLVDLAASWTGARELDDTFVGMYTRHPEKMAAAQLWLWAWLWIMAVLSGLLLNLCGLGDIGTSLGTGVLPPALAMGFVISSLIVLVAISILAQKETEKWPMTGRSKTLQAVVSAASGIVLVLAFCAPYLLAVQFELGWDDLVPMLGVWCVALLGITFM